VRAETAFKRMLALPGVSILDVCFGAEGVVVTVGLRRRRRVCARCGQTGSQLQIHDRRVKRWRHLDLGSVRCIIECRLRLLRCPDCGVKLEPVPWARVDAPYTRDLSVEAPYVKGGGMGRSSGEGGFRPPGSPGSRGRRRGGRPTLGAGRTGRRCATRRDRRGGQVTIVLPAAVGGPCDRRARGAPALSRCADGRPVT
jgi:transposase IS204/IS1001/IS1096/IS1165 family protein